MEALMTFCFVFYLYILFYFTSLCLGNKLVNISEGKSNQKMHMQIRECVK